MRKSASVSSAAQPASLSALALQYLVAEEVSKVVGSSWLISSVSSPRFWSATESAADDLVLHLASLLHTGLKMHMIKQLSHENASPQLSLDRMQFKRCACCVQLLCNLQHWNVTAAAAAVAVAATGEVL
jgi:hypothetical protein